jgi:hypothetical protein
MLWHFTGRLGLEKTIRAMADGPLSSQVGTRICNGLGIMRACLETQKLEQLEARMADIADRVARDRTNAARERTKPPRSRPNSRPGHVRAGTAFMRTRKRSACELPQAAGPKVLVVCLGLMQHRPTLRCD